MIDLNTEFGKRVLRRLQAAPTIWLTTVSRDGTPQPRPVWFLWTGEAFLIFSRPEGAKLRHISRNPRVALHLDSDGQGGDIIVILGEAVIEPQGSTPQEMTAYIRKYESGMAHLGLSPEQFQARYATSIRITPTTLRGH